MLKGVFKTLLNYLKFQKPENSSIEFISVFFRGRNYPQATCKENKTKCDLKVSKCTSIIIKRTLI